MEKISVIIPVYNVEEYLKVWKETEKGLPIVLLMHTPFYEIILINDGSKDKSGQICDAFAKADSRVVVVHKENSGVSDTRNIGIARATGQYIAFIDADDWIEKNMVYLRMGVRRIRRIITMKSLFIVVL